MKKFFSALAVSTLLIVGVTTYTTQAKTTDELIVDDVVYCAGLYYSVAKTENNSAKTNSILYQVASHLEGMAIRLYPEKAQIFSNKVRRITTEFDLYRSLEEVKKDHSILKLVIKSYMKCDFFTRRIDNIIEGTLTADDYYKKYGTIPRDIIGSNR